MRRFFCICLFSLLFLVTQAMADVTLIVRREAQASGNYVRICDVARIEGPKEQVSEVGLTVLGPTPAKGKPLEISRWDIEARLYEMGVTAKVIFSGNDTVKVFGGGKALIDDRQHDAAPREPDPIGLNLSERDRGAAVPAARPAPAKMEAVPGLGAVMPGSLEASARQRIGDTISSYLAGRYKRPDIEVEADIVSLSEAVPYSAHEIEVDEAMEGKIPGRAVLRLKVRETPEAEAKRVTATVDASVHAPALVAARQMYKGEVLGPKDVLVKRIRMESGKGYLPPNPRAAVGRELAKNLPAGAPLVASESTATEAVKRGAEIVVVKEGTGWEVRTRAKALAGGMVGDTITVEDLGTKAKFHARITDFGKAVFTGKIDKK